MFEFSQAEARPDDGRVGEAAGARFSEPENAPRPRCLFCRYRKPVEAQAPAHAQD